MQILQLLEILGHEARRMMGQGLPTLAIWKQLCSIDNILSYIHQAEVPLFPDSCLVEQVP